MKLLILATLLLTPSFVCAQITGVPVDSLTPEGMERVEVNLPFHGGVELFFASQGQTDASVRVDVELARDSADAADAADWFERTSTTELPAIAGIGDRAQGSRDLVAFTLENVFVVVRRLNGLSDAPALARRIDAALRRAEPAPRAVSASIAELTLGVNPLQLPAEVLGAHVEASGAASARRTRAGWVVVLSESSRYALTIVTVDRWLRRTTSTVNRR